MPVPLTTAYTAMALRAAARASDNTGQTRRLLALAAIDDGATSTEAAVIGGVTLQIVRDWVVKRNAPGPDGLIDRKGGGTRSILSDRHRHALTKAIEGGPIFDVHGVKRWGVIDPCQLEWDGNAVVITKTTLSAELRGTKSSGLCCRGATRGR